MAGNREGAFVDAPAAPQEGRLALHTIISNGVWIVGTTPVPVGDWTPDALLTASRAFAERLYALSKLVADQQPGDFDPEEDRAELDESLRLSETNKLKILLQLSQIGQAARNELPAAVLQEFRFNGFVNDAAEIIVENAPALSFQEGWQAPILWEMLYEGSTVNLPNWRQFWGFSVPISHWLHVTRTEQIRLRAEAGFFTAINEDLDFAGQEIALLAKHFAKVRHSSLADGLRRRVSDALRAKALDEDALQAWWEDCHGQWLNQFLADVDEDPDMAKLLADQWKRRALAETLKEYLLSDIIHFACHCEPSPQTEFLSLLNMKIAGESILLDVALLADSMMERKLASSQDPGPLVFLNACGTAELAGAFERPGFPDKWIRKQGALAVLATLCPVPDYFAHAFARKFYEFLREGLQDTTGVHRRYRYLAETLLATRRYFMEEFNNPLGLAYTLYAMRGAHIEADFPVEAGGAP